MIPAMTYWIGPDQHVYQAAAMIVNFFLVLPALYQHVRARAIQVRVIRRLIPLSLISILAGVGLSELAVFQNEGESRLRLLFGLFVLSFALIEIARLMRPAVGRSARSSSIERPAPAESGDARPVPPCPQLHMTWARAAVVALPAGLIAGLLGVGGGIVAVPLQRRFLGIPLPQAIANSAATISATSFVGSIFKNVAIHLDAVPHGRSSVQLAALLIPTAMLGAYFGAMLAHRLPVRRLAILFIALLMYVAARMILEATGMLPG